MKKIKAIAIEMIPFVIGMSASSYLGLMQNTLGEILMTALFGLIVLALFLTRYKKTKYKFSYSEQ